MNLLLLLLGLPQNANHTRPHHTIPTEPRHTTEHHATPHQPHHANHTTPTTLHHANHVTPTTPHQQKKLQVSVGTQSEPVACSSLGTQTKQVMQPVKSVNYASVMKGNIRDVPDGRQSRSAQNRVVPVPSPRCFVAGAPQIDRTRVKNETFVPVEWRKKVLRENVLERIRTSKSMILRPKEGETLSELRKSFHANSVEASPERSPKISAIKSNEAKNFLVVDLLNEVEQRKVEDLIKSKLVFSRPTGFDPAVTVYNVPSDLTEGELSDALAAKNGLLFASGEKERLKVCRRFRNSRGNCDVVVRMAPAKHRQLGEKKDKRVFLLFSAHFKKIWFRPSGASSVSVVGIPTLKASVKIAGSAADAEKKTMWRLTAQAGPSASTACGRPKAVGRGPYGH